MLAGLIPSDGYEEESVQASGGLLTMIGIPWFIGASAQPLLSFLHGISLCIHFCLSVDFPFLYRDSKYWIRAHPTDLTLTD